MIGMVEWFPQEHAELFYICKGILAVVAVVMLVSHMMHTWDNVTGLGQRLRYFALLGLTALVAFASAEQVHESVTVSYRNLGGFAAICLVIVAMWFSIREDFRRELPTS